MPGEAPYAKELVAKAMEEAEAQASFDRDSMGRALIMAVIQQYGEYRPLSDIRQELQFTIDNLDEDEFVITRGC